jgi:hypothetical protein
MASIAVFIKNTVIEDEVTVTGPNKVISYDYAGAGPDGSRLLRKEKGAVTLYLGSQEIRLDTVKDSLSGTRYYSHGGKPIAVSL